jgi:vacuolar-type H+-ATPase subunit I/STV1
MRVQVLIKRSEVRQQQDIMTQSLEQFQANLESQSLSKDYEKALTRLGDKFLALLSVTSDDKEVYKFINSFGERDKIFYRQHLRSETLGDGQIMHTFISKE